MTPIESPPISGVTSSNPPHFHLRQPPPFVRSTTDFTVAVAVPGHGNSRIRSDEERKKRVSSARDFAPEPTDVSASLGNSDASFAETFCRWFD